MAVRHPKQGNIMPTVRGGGRWDLLLDFELVDV
jgi:hypothetical protein